MTNILYTVAIRTVGKGGEKYAALLQSISCLKPQPQEVLVCLPEGATPPVEQLGWERFVYLPKGMMSQRIYALEQIRTEYVLFTDDDIQFDQDFVIKLHRAITEVGYDIAVGEILAFLPPAHGIKKVIPALLAAAAPTLFHKDRYVTILRSAGWTYHRFVPNPGYILPTQSAIGCMFYTSLSAMKHLRFEEELAWAQHGHLAPADDQIMFYKAYRVGLKTGVVTDAHFDHLDAKSATASEEARKNKAFYSAYNRTVFWHRFIYSFEKNAFDKAIARIAFWYFRTSGNLFARLRNVLRKDVTTYVKEMSSGYKAAFQYIHSDEYTALPEVRRDSH